MDPRLYLAEARDPALVWKDVRVTTHTSTMRLCVDPNAPITPSQRAADELNRQDSVARTMRQIAHWQSKGWK